VSSATAAALLERRVLCEQLHEACKIALDLRQVSSFLHADVDERAGVAVGSGSIRHRCLRRGAAPPPHEYRSAAAALGTPREHAFGSRR
jgi:hypothetical protein